MNGIKFMRNIVIIGGGGHAKVLIELIRTYNEYEIIGILDSQLKVKATVSEVPVLGGDALLPQLYTAGIKNVCIGVGSVKANSKREMLYEKAKQLGFSVPYLLHPEAKVSKSVNLKEGVQVMMGAIVQTDSLIGENTIINTGSIIEHDCKIGKHILVCPGAVISGGCIVGSGSFIGAGATIIQGIKVGRNSIVGAGAVVINDIPDNTNVVGVPAK